MRNTIRGIHRQEKSKIKAMGMLRVAKTGRAVCMYMLVC